LQIKLQEKSRHEPELAPKVFWDIKHLLEEDKIIESKIKNYIYRNKNVSYIRSKMREKYFQADKVEAFLREEVWIDEGSILNKVHLLKKIENYKQKGKSQLYIRNKLIDRTEDKNIVEECLNEVFWQEWELEVLKREYDKLLLALDKEKDKQKIMKKLLSKWFRYDDVKKVL
jgi:SOS response regulatory protein OraA/RecX